MNIAALAQNTASLKDYSTELALNQGLAPTSLAKYKQCLAAFITWLDDRPTSPQAAKMFLAELRERGYKPGSVQLYYHAIKPFLEFQGIPFKLKFKKVRQLPQYHSAEDLKSILSVIDNRGDNWSKLGQRDRLIILTLAFTGLRASELINLRPCDITNDYVFVRHGKGSKDRTIPLAETIRKPLSDYIEHEGLRPTERLFSIQRRRLYTIVTQYARAAGINDISPHSLRHYFATRLVEQKAQLNAIQELLGHADISTTAVYLDLIPSHLKSAISLLDESISVSTKNIPTPKKGSRSESLSLSLSSENTTCSNHKRKELRPCGLSLNRGKPLTQSLILVPSRASPSTGQGPEASFALARAAPTVLPGSPKDGDTRPASLSAAIPFPGSSESKA